MSLTNYADLQTSVATWLQRSDLTATIPDFISLFEACANRRLRVRQQETTAELTPASGTVALPGDYLSWRRLTWTGTPTREMDYVEPSWLQSAFPSSPVDLPSVFTIEGGNIILRPVDATNTVLEFVYFAKIPALSSGPNWLMTAHPDLYLFGTLVEAQAYAVNADTAVLWKARRDELFDEISMLSNKTRGASAIRVMTQTP